MAPRHPQFLKSQSSRTRVCVGKEVGTLYGSPHISDIAREFGCE